MLLESLRLRAIEALRVLGIARTIAVPSELKVEPLCNALTATRDLLASYGDSISPAPHELHRLAVLKVFAEELPRLVTALEIVSTRSESILKLHGSDGQVEGFPESALGKSGAQ
jgi:hypothetical protein